MKKYVLLIVLISLMPHLQGVTREKTLTLKNETGDSYTVTYKLPEFSGPIKVPLTPNLVKQIPHTWEDITEMSYSRDGSPLSHKVDMNAVKDKAAQGLSGPFDYNHLTIAIIRGTFGSSSYRIDGRFVAFSDGE